MPRKDWAHSEIGIVRACIASDLSYTDAAAELARWGYHRSLEGVAAKMQQERRRLSVSGDAEHAEMLKYSVSRKWL